MCNYVPVWKSESLFDPRLPGPHQLHRPHSFFFLPSFLLGTVWQRGLLGGSRPRATSLTREASSLDGLALLLKGGEVARIFSLITGERRAQGGSGEKRETEARWTWTTLLQGLLNQTVAVDAWLVYP